MAYASSQEQADTPALLMDLDIVERNIERMQALCRTHATDLASHTKTHKLPYRASLQMRAGASRATVAKVSEAQLMADYGISPLFIAHQVVGRQKAERLATLAESTDISIGLDSLANAEELSRVLSDHGVEVSVLIEVDTGLHRAGLEDPAAVVDLARHVSRLDGLALAGIFTHEGHVYRLSGPDEIKAATEAAGRLMLQIHEELEKAGIECERVSMGSTPSARFAAALEGITEIRPGTYIFNDCNQVALGAARIEDCAVSILSTVVSTPSNGRAILDCGSKTLAADSAVPASRGFGMLRGLPEARIVRLYEEHAVVECPPDVRLKVGDRVEVIPNHICPVFNLFDEVHVLRGDRVVALWGIEGRGRSQ